jgi:hypothetical protein
MIPFIPETMSANRARFAAALEPLYIITDYQPPSPRPGEQRRHVFDFEDGMRIIASRDTIIGRHFLHASASMNADRVGKHIHLDSAKVVIGSWRAVLCSLSGRTDWQLMGLEGPQKVPHWFVELKDGSY